VKDSQPLRMRLAMLEQEPPHAEERAERASRSMGNDNAVAVS